MNLLSVTVENYRCFSSPERIEFSDLTTFVGKNDVGKSTILECLEIFFNSAAVKMQALDSCVHCTGDTVSITCEFSNLPDSLSLDAGAETSLESEYLVSANGTLIVEKAFDCSKATPTVEVFAHALHPSAEGVENLLDLKEKELQALIKSKGLDVSLKGNPQMRKAIWGNVANLKLDVRRINLSKAKEDGKKILPQIELNLPIFALFQSDRKSQDSDGEVQNPMRGAISAAIAEVRAEINQIQGKVEERVTEIAQRTHLALQEIDSNLASELTPEFTPPTLGKWSGLFSINLKTDHGIPLNKRGSGVRRLVLVSFFRAEAERRLSTESHRGVIYAVEEPETAQHPNNQKMLIEAFKSLSGDSDCQVILTTHSPGFAADLPVDSIRYVVKRDDGCSNVNAGTDVFGEVAEALGVTPDSRVKVIVCVEGPTDIDALCCLSECASQEHAHVPNLRTDSRVAFIVLGGSTLKHWVSKNYLQGLGRPEVHIYDNDVPKYQDSVEEVNARDDRSWATTTLKLEIENYLHSDAIRDAFGFDLNVLDNLNEQGKGVPSIFGELYAKSQGYSNPLKDQNSKKKLAEFAFPKMSYARLVERDPDGEMVGYFRRIGELLD